MTEQQDNKAKKPRLNLTTSQVAASALAACCASIVASYLGVAGTVIGAAVGSVVATTGAAIYGHLFRTGGDKIKQTLLVNGQEVEVEVDRDDPVNEATMPAGRFYGAQANAATRTVDLWHPKTPTGETQVITEEPEESAKTEAVNIGAVKTKAGTSPIGAQIVRIKKYRKPMGIAAAIIAVFCISIVVGVIAGAPVRSAGSNSSPATVTTTTTVTDTGHTQGQSGSGSSASSSSSASPSSGATSSTSATSPSSATSSPAAGSTASPTASPSTAATSTGQARSGATSTGSPTS
jgi:hypothetical protein